MKEKYNTPEMRLLSLLSQDILTSSGLGEIMDWNDPNSYHMVLNSDLLPMELCVKLICDAYQGT